MADEKTGRQVPEPQRPQRFGRDVVFVVRYPSGGISAVYATLEAAWDAAEYPADGRYVEPWVLHGGIVDRRVS